MTATAQTVPEWYDSNMREMSYPAGQYFTGYSEGQRHSGESLEAAIKRVQDAARVEAVSTIRVHVKNTTVNQGLSQTLKTMEGTFRQSVREVSSATTTSVDVQIPGLKTDVYQTPSGIIAAFAWVKKSTLVRQLEKQITVCLTKIETSLDQVDLLVANGQKMQARQIAEETVPQFAEVDEFQKLLAAVDSDADEESLQLLETRKLQKRLIAYLAQLKNGINIYLVCNAYLFGTDYMPLKGEIQGELSKLGCTFVGSASQSDWAIYVTSTAREYNTVEYGGNKTYYVYVDVKVVIEKTSTKQRIYENQWSEKGGHTLSNEQAARAAYKEIAPKVSEIIKQQITQ